MEYSKEALMEAKKKIWGVGENMGTEESKKIWEENAQFWDNADVYKRQTFAWTLTVTTAVCTAGNASMSWSGASGNPPGSKWLRTRCV